MLYRSRSAHTSRILSSFSLLILCLLTSLSSVAHEITPSIINFSKINEKTFELRLDTNLEALIAEIGAEHEDTSQSPRADLYNELRALPIEAFHQRALPFIEELPKKFNFLGAQQDSLPLIFTFNELQTQPNTDLDIARESIVSFQVSSELPIEALSFSWSPSLGDVIFRFNQDDTVVAALWIPAGETSDLIEPNLGTTEQSLIDYLIIGFEHIVPLGIDHILFVIGLYLLSQKLSSLLWQVSAFTLAHTITLAMATLGWVSVSPAIVEPLIAASITYVAVENLFRHNLSRGRIALVFGFGLLHGLGFAGVLSEIGLNPDAFIPSLIAFNVGVELGQLAVILLMYLLLGLWLGKTRYWESWVRTPISIIIALIGAFWFVQRIFF